MPEPMPGICLSSAVAAAAAGGAAAAPAERLDLHTAEALLRHEPPCALELERAIAELEDQLMPLLRRLPAPRGGRLIGPGWEAVLTAAGSENGRVSLDAVEALFNRLADVANGAAPASRAIPTNRRFAAQLLALREVMHHGGYSHAQLPLTLLSAADSPAPS